MRGLVANRRLVPAPADPPPAGVAAADLAPADLLAALAAGELRAAEPDASAPDGWLVRPDVKAAILACFADRTMTSWTVGPFAFHDRANLPPVDPGPDRRIVPGGTSIRAGSYLAPGVIVMPPSYVNVGAWVGPGTMVDSHVLVGSCAQIGARVHLAAGVTIGGVLEPAGARPVIVEDDAFIGAGSRLLEGVLVRAGAVIGAGVVLTGTSRLYDLVEERELVGTADRPLVVPAGSVVVPGSRPALGAWAAERGLAITTALIVKRRDPGTDARLALEAALR
ncbi:MAG: 2,3,4,5-tetrahydropyridine-2,6-dicarboxylate N-succinyltransferase [Chloroflexota bacterium]|jgi:2,3,4,5-tetrahydropyridine-2-carboxylate N-succinyltransferase|nr:2,3,4,5-tetrahydropyridine-2,6-dicarboxylate N-succinyltransferase [Chloroflexota bacterium]